MVHRHTESGAAVTAAAIRVPIEQADQWDHRDGRGQSKDETGRILSQLRELTGLSEERRADMRANGGGPVAAAHARSPPTWIVPVMSPRAA